MLEDTTRAEDLVVMQLETEACLLSCFDKDLLRGRTACLNQGLTPRDFLLFEHGTLFIIMMECAQPVMQYDVWGCRSVLADILRRVMAQRGYTEPGGMRAWLDMTLDLRSSSAGIEKYAQLVAWPSVAENDAHARLVAELSCRTPGHNVTGEVVWSLPPKSRA